MLHPYHSAWQWKWMLYHLQTQTCWPNVRFQIFSLPNVSFSPGGGIAIGTVFSVLFFKRKKWPIILGGGFGIGLAYSNCERDVNALFTPGTKGPCEVKSWNLYSHRSNSSCRVIRSILFYPATSAYNSFMCNNQIV